MSSVGPLLGYNNNIPYKGRVYHVQTEDSGAKRPHVITHLFADGGRIVKTTKTSYAQIVGSENLADKVRTIMRDQHRGMVVSLREGEFDELIDPGAAMGADVAASADTAEADHGEADHGEIDSGETYSGIAVASDGGAGPLAAGAPTSEPLELVNASVSNAGEPMVAGAGAYKKIVGRSSSRPPRSRSPEASTRGNLLGSPRMLPTNRGGALFGHAVRSQRPPQMGPRTIEPHDDPFAQRYTSDRSFDEVIAAFFES